MLSFGGGLYNLNLLVDFWCVYIGRCLNDKYKDILKEEIIDILKKLIINIFELKEIVN